MRNSLKEECDYEQLNVAMHPYFTAWPKFAGIGKTSFRRGDEGGALPSLAHLVTGCRAREWGTAAHPTSAKRHLEAKRMPVGGVPPCQTARQSPASITVCPRP